MKHRHLLNEMLKIPEHTFSDLNPQVLIASQVCLEKLAFLPGGCVIFGIAIYDTMCTANMGLISHHRNCLLLIDEYFDEP